MIKKILILCNYPFPEGMAATNRIFAYSKGLNQNGIKTEVLTISSYGIKTTEKFEQIKNYFDIKCIHPHYYYKDGNKFKRIIFDLNLFKIKTIIYLIKACKNKDYDSILLSNDDKYFLFLFTIILKLLKFKIGFITDEYPPRIRKLRHKISKFDIFFYNIFNKFVSYRIVISNSLKTYYNVNFGVKPTCILNTIIDHTRFDGVANQITTTKSLVYVGNCELKKDNVDNIIEAFKLLNAEYPDYILEIYGKPSKRDENYLKSISIGFENRILFKGRINYDQVPQVLFNSNILVTSQPDTVRAIGGFPTKLGEYLLTGKPSLFTIVGEINNYIIDCENGFLVEPNNPIQYFNKLKFIIENYEFSLDVAEKGKTYILSNFTSKTATIELAAFFQKV